MRDALIVDGKQFDIVLAIDVDEQRKGLMNVYWPPPVMAFPYKTASYHKFWMKDTPSPLDMLFCVAGEVIYIGSGEPFNEQDLIGPDVPTDLVIEGPQGFAKANNIQIGSKVRIRYSQEHLQKILKEGNV